LKAWTNIVASPTQNRASRATALGQVERRVCDGRPLVDPLEVQELRRVAAGQLDAGLGQTDAEDENEEAHDQKERPSSSFSQLSSILLPTTGGA